MKDRNCVTQLDNSKIYVVGLGFVSLVSSRLGSLELKTEADQILNNLAVTLNQVVFLGVENDYDVMYLDKKGGPDEGVFCGLVLHCHFIALVWARLF